MYTGTVAGSRCVRCVVAGALRGGGRVRMSSALLARRLARVSLDRAAYGRLRAHKEDVLQRRRLLRAKLKDVLRRQPLRRTCRLCMKDGRHKIFDDTREFDMPAEIKYVLGLEVSPEDNMPQHVCDACLESLKAAAEFKRTSELCQWRLQQELEMISDEQGAYDLYDDEDSYGDIHGGYFRNDDADGVAREWKCNKCRKIFNAKEEFQAHDKLPNCKTRRLAEEVDSYVCEVCGKEFKTKFRLKRHCTVHSTELKYACDRCPYKARWPTALVHHMRVHNGEKPVQCPYCPARFVTPSNLASHKRRHFPPQFKCTICQRAFTNKQGLGNHVVSQHSNVKAHHCTICGKSFATRRLMRRHELKNHNCPKRRAGTMPVYLQIEHENMAEQAAQQHTYMH